MQRPSSVHHLGWCWWLKGERTVVPIANLKFTQVCQSRCVSISRLRLQIKKQGVVTYSGTEVKALSQVSLNMHSYIKAELWLLVRYRSDDLREVMCLVYLGGIDLHGLPQELLSFVMQVVVEQQVGRVDQWHIFVLRWSWVQGLAQTLQSSRTVSLSSPKQPCLILKQPARYTDLHTHTHTE